MFVVLRRHGIKHHGGFFPSLRLTDKQNSKTFNVYILVIKAICYTVINQTKRKENKSLNKV